jgi:hypothetical protein
MEERASWMETGDIFEVCGQLPSMLHPLRLRRLTFAAK